MLGLADGLPVVLTPLEGTGQVVTLENGDMPEKGVEVPAELQLVATDFPGGRRRSVQLLGLSEGDIQLKGWLRDVWGSQQGHAAEQWSALRGLFVSQVLVELSWGELLVRRGYVRRLRPRFSSEAAIEYELDFLVVEADEATVITAPFVPQPPLPHDFFDILDDILSVCEAVLDAAATASALVALAT